MDADLPWHQNVHRDFNGNAIHHSHGHTASTMDCDGKSYAEFSGANIKPDLGVLR